MLFFSTIIQRIFGVTRSKAIKSRKNCCSYYPDIRIRKVASSALTSIIHPSCIMETLDHLLYLMDEWRSKDSLSPSTRKTDRSNILHSLLLQVYALLYSTMEIHSSPVYLLPSAYISNTEYTSIIDRLMKSFSWLNNPNIVQCPLIRLLYLKTLSPYYNHHHQFTPVESNSSLNSLEYEYTEGNVNALIDYAIYQGKNNIQVHKEVEQLLKSLNDLRLLTSALRRICLYLCSKVGDPTDCSMNLESINAMAQCGPQPNTEVLKITENLFTIQTLLGIYYHQSVCNANTSNNNNNNDNHVLTELKSMYKAEFKRYFYALLTILIHSTNTTTTTTASLFDCIHKLLDSDYQRLLSTAVPNSLITRGGPEVSFTAIQLYSYVNLIHITDDKKRKNDNGVIQNSSLRDHLRNDPFSLLCRLCNSRFSHSAREKLNPTGAEEEDEEELNYAALYSLRLLDMQRLVAFTSQKSGNTDERETVIAEVFITLIKNLVKPASIKLEKLACEITQNLLVSSNTQSKCVLQSPFVLLPRLIDFLLKFNSRVFYKRLLHFTEEQLITKRISKRGECTHMPIVQQTTFEEEYDTVELIKIVFSGFSKSSSVANNNNNNNSSVDIKQHDSLLHMMNSTNDEVFCCDEIELNELYDLSICKPDTVTTLYLNRYIMMNRRIKCF
ncbi:unnamed protein product [Trichobilharzia szidati]|nr:unnamed protein product [Trichobilharzia szidati]